MLEEGWLIEQGGLCLGGSICGPEWVTFTDPKAIRFARQKDGDNMLAALKAFSSKENCKDAFAECVVAGHTWG